MNSGIDSAGHGAQGSTFRPSGVPIGSFSGHLSHGPTRSPLPTVFSDDCDKSASHGLGTFALGVSGQDDPASSRLVELFRHFVERCFFPGLVRQPHWDHVIQDPLSLNLQMACLENGIG